MPTTLIEPAAVAAHLADPDWAIVDCRFELALPEWGALAWAAGHIPNALYAHLDHDLSGPRTALAGRHPLPAIAALSATFWRWGIDKEVQVVAYRLKRRALTLVDAGSADRFAGENEPLDRVAGHIPGARNHPFSGNLDADGRFLTAPELRRRWADTLRERRAQTLIAMCGSGVTACHNLLALEAAGLPGARLYAGSWSEWIRDPARPVARGAET